MVDFISMTPIDKGWSGDKKYCVTDKIGQKYLLRISPAEKYQRKKREHEIMNEAAALGVDMCKSLAFGQNDEGIYALHSWIDGYDAEEYIPTLTENEQYDYGLKAGRTLKKLHSIPAPEGTEDWAAYYNRKTDRKMEAYMKCPLKYENGQAFIECISSGRHLINGRKSAFQHGDYHIGNMMVGKDKKLYIIDFERFDYGDPWEEFNRIVWCARKAPAFTKGLADGYFDGAIPMDFWKLLAFYISVNTLSSLPWAIPFGEEQVMVMRRQAEDVLYWYDGMRRAVPRWYTE